MSAVVPYSFRKELQQIHLPNRNDTSVTPQADQIKIDDSWRILVYEDDEPAILTAAQDAQDYFKVSMGVFLPLQILPHNKLQKTKFSKQIVFTVKAQNDLVPPTGSYRIEITDYILIIGNNGRGTAHGWYWLESQMNLICAPIVSLGEFCNTPIFTPRMTHSGYGLDMFPDPYLARLAHLGIDTLLVFTKSANHTPLGFLDFNELIDRASRYGMDVYAYSYLCSDMHPDDPRANDYYEEIYGTVFEKSPRLKGIVLVGESVEFPSRDPHTTGRMYTQPNPDGLPDEKPSPGWWPCEDYPQWLTLVRDTVHRHNPSADIIFWTYNWGYVQEEYRLALIRNIPKDITLLATFEMFETVTKENYTFNCVDYTLAFEGPGGYFSSEAAEAKKQGIRLYSMTNTGGLTWDVGIIPYEPAPWLWIKRLKAVQKAHQEWNLCGTMECHHYGLWPSVISELTQIAYTVPDCDLENEFTKIVRRDFTSEQLDQALSAWKCFNDAFELYPCTNEDQYGPFRVGPSYPLFLHGGPAIPSEEEALWGSKICNVNYRPNDCGRAPLGNLRFPTEIERLARMIENFEEGAIQFDEISKQLSGWRKENAIRLSNMGLFLKNCCVTARHTKQWYLLKTKLDAAETPEEIRQIISSLDQIAEDEIINASNTIPLVEKDSRLGWEPSMEYITDRAHLEWKIKATKISQKGLQMYQNSLRFK